MIVFECFCYGSVHIAKLRTVTLIKDKHHMTLKNCMPTISSDESIELLDRGDYDPRFWITELFCKDCGTGIAIGCAFLKLVVLTHGLVVQIFAIYHKQHLMDVIELTD